MAKFKSFLLFFVRILVAIYLINDGYKKFNKSEFYGSQLAKDFSTLEKATWNNLEI